MLLRLLGPVQLEDLGGPIHVGGPKERAALAMLAIHEGAVVGEDQLVEALWPDQPPRTATRTLQSYISRIRRVLQDGAGPISIEAVGGGYRLQATTPDALDIGRVEALAEQARAAAASGDHAAAADRLKEALSAWSGRALGEFADEPWAQPASVRLSELRSNLFEERVDADLRCGRHALLVGELETVCEANPFRERMWALWMIALYRSGRQADALAVSRQLRRRLADELGVDPSAELQTLENAILIQDPSLDTTSLATPEHASDGIGIGFPSALAGPGPGSFVGRGEELDALHDCWRAAGQGACRAVFVGGEPGIGKSRLVGEFAGGLHASGAIVLFGTCEEDLDVAYQPFTEALSAYVADCDIDVLRSHVRKHGGELARVVGELATRLAPDLPAPITAEPEAERFRLFEAIASLLETASQRQPVLLVLDDLQWANKPTLLLLRHLLRQQRAGSLMVVGLYRATETSDILTDTLADLRRSHDVRRIMLDGLDEHGVAAYVEAVAGAPLDERGRAFARRLCEETAGSPFFVGEVLRHLAETGAMARTADGWASPTVEEFELPASVREVIARRVGRLPEATRAALTLASVIGPTFSLATLERANGLRGDALLDAVEPAVAAGMVRDVEGRPGTFVFAHELVRRALYDEPSVLRRARMHRRVAEALEDAPVSPKLSPNVSEIARHYLEAAADGVSEKAVEYAVLAAERAVARLAYEEAVRFYEHALEVVDWAGLGDGARACDLTLGLADAHWRAGDVLPSREAYSRAAEIARSLGDPQRLALAALRSDTDLGGYCHSIRADAHLIALLEEALEMVADDHPALRARLLARLAIELFYVRGTSDRRIDLAREAVAIAESLGDETVILFTRRCQMWSALQPTDPLEERLHASAEIIALSEAAGAIEVAYESRFLRVTLFLEAGDLAAADAEAAEGAKLAEQLGVPGFLPWVSAYRSVRAWIDGRLEDAEQLNTQALEEAMQHRTDPELVFTLIGGQAFANQYLRDMTDVIPAMEAMNEEQGPASGEIRAGLALAYRCADRREDCRRVFEDLASNDFEAIDTGAGWLINFALAAQACAYLGDTERAAFFYERLTPLADRWCAGVILVFGPISWILGRLATTLGHYDDAERHFSDALARTSAAGARIFFAECCYDYSSMLARRTAHLDRARDLVTTASRTAEELDLPMLRTWTSTLQAELADR